MKKAIFTGVGTALITPMLPDGAVNYRCLGELLDQQITGGADGVVVCGTTGEGSTLTQGEWQAVIGYTVERVGGRIPVLAGAGSNDTAHAVALAKEAEALGVDGLLEVTPYYNKTSQVGLIRHFNRIADATALPILLYNVPSRTGMTIQPETYRALANHPNIVGTKEAGTDLSAIGRTAALCGEELLLYAGNDDMILPILSLGGVGVISVLGNLLPGEVHSICAHFFGGRVEESARLQLALLPLIHLLFSDVNPIPVKEALNLLGWEAGPVREPLVPLSPALRSALGAELERLELL